MPRTRAGRLVHGGRRGRILLAVAAVASALVCFGLGEVTDHSLAEAILFGFVISVTLAAGAFGLRGGLFAGLACTVLTVFWWLEHDRYEGTAWVVARAAALIAMGVLLGWFLDQAQLLLHDLAHHQEFSVDMFVTADFDGRLTRVSPSVTRLLGYTREEFLSQPYLEQVHPDDVERTMAAVEIQAGGDPVLNFQNRFRAKDGTYRWLEWTSRPDLEEGKMLAVARDITERKELEGESAPTRNGSSRRCRSAPTSWSALPASSPPPTTRR